MRRVDRTHVPRPLVLEPYRPGASRQSAAAVELEANGTKHTPGASGSFRFAAYKHDSIKTALHQLFRGKCAYCEGFYDALAPVDVEHYRPKGALEGVANHSGYWWLAADWENLLPSCLDCNRRRRQRIVSLDDPLAHPKVNAGKKDAFPVAGSHATFENGDLDAEGALLINPCRDDPSVYLKFHLGPEPLLALVLPLDPENAPQRGAVSIQTYGLNRLGLVQERTRILRRLEFLRHMIVELDAVADGLSHLQDAAIGAALIRIDALAEAIVAEAKRMAEPDQPFSALVVQWLREWHSHLTGKSPTVLRSSAMSRSRRKPRRASLT
jgi:uncharacterized protein (TIGR02646 family)